MYHIKLNLFVLATIVSMTLGCSKKDSRLTSFRKYAAVSTKDVGAMSTDMSSRDVAGSPNGNNSGSVGGGVNNNETPAAVGGGGPNGNNSGSVGGGTNNGDSSGTVGGGGGGNGGNSNVGGGGSTPTPTPAPGGPNGNNSGSVGGGTNNGNGGNSNVGGGGGGSAPTPTPAPGGPNGNNSGAVGGGSNTGGGKPGLIDLIIGAIGGNNNGGNNNTPTPTPTPSVGGGANSGGNDPGTVGGGATPSEPPPGDIPVWRYCFSPGKDNRTISSESVASASKIGVEIIDINTSKTVCVVTDGVNDRLNVPAGQISTLSLQFPASCNLTENNYEIVVRDFAKSDLKNTGDNIDEIYGLNLLRVSTSDPSDPFSKKPINEVGNWTGGGRGFYITRTSSSSYWCLGVTTDKGAHFSDLDCGYNREEYIKGVTKDGIHMNGYRRGNQYWSYSVFYSDMSVVDPLGTEMCNAYGTPLVVDMRELGEAPLNLTSQAQGVNFDLLGENSFPFAHAPKRISWIKDPRIMFLVKPNQFGQVNGINEMFGDNTRGPDGKFAENGYAALAKYKMSASDAEITEKNPVFKELRLWSDKNLDGKVQTGELLTLKEMKIKSISLNYNRKYDRKDTFGNRTAYRSEVVLENKKTLPMYDIIFKYQSVPSASTSLLGQAGSAH